MALLITLLLVASAVAQNGLVAQPQVQAQVARMPLAFEPNQGQADRQVKFLSRGPGYLLLLTRDEAVLSLSGAKAGARDIVRLKLAGSNRNAKAEGQESLGGKTNYFLGNDPAKWRTNIANYGRVRYSQVYPGIDLLYYGKQNTLEHDFIVAPHADPSKIALDVKGAKQLRVDAKGNLILETANGKVQLDKPFIFQTDKKGNRVEVAGGFALQGSRVGFEVGAYDKSRELVIDPVLNYSTYFGGNASTTVNAITVDAGGNAYITGSTASSAATLAGTACASCGTPDRDGTTKLDVFVAKLNATGTAYTFTTIIGGTGDEHGNAIAVDGSGNVFVAGQTSSGTFPTTTGAYRTSVGNVLPDGFALKLNATGSTLSYSTYLNGGAVATDGADDARAIAVNAVGQIIVGGSTASTTFYPASFTIGTDLTQNGAIDGFLLRLNPAGTGAADLLYGTYLGGTTDDIVNGMAIVTGSRVVSVGSTTSSDFPQGGGPPDNAIGGTQDGFVSMLSTGGAFLTSAVCIDSTTDRTILVTTTTAHGFSVGDSLTVTGATDSANIDFSDVNKTVVAVGSTTTFTYSENSCNNNNGQSAGISGTSRVFGRRTTNTYAGGTLVDSLNAVAVDGTGAIYAVGTTASITASNGVPNQTNAIQASGLNTTASGTETDAFILKVSADMQNFLGSALLGGTGDDTGTGITVNPTCTSNCEAVVVGTTASATRFNSNSLQSAINGAQDGFIARVNSTFNGLIYSTYFGGAGSDNIQGVAGVFSGTSGALNVAVVAANIGGTIGTPSGFGAGATVTSSAAQTTADGTATQSVVIAKLAANNAAAPTLTVTGAKNIDPIGQSTAQTSSVVYTWTVTDTNGTNAATNVTLDVPTPQDGSGNDLLSITSTNNPACTTKIGSATQPGGMTCVFGNVAANNGTASVQVTASPTAASHCDNSGACTVPTITLTGRTNAAEPSTAASNTVVSTIAPVTDLVITGSAVSTPGGNAIYRLGIDTSLLYTVTVTNNSGATIAGNDAALDVLIESVYSTDPQFVVSSVTLNGNPVVLGALVQGVDGCFNDLVNHKVQCNVASIAAGGAATVLINGSFNAGTINPAVQLLNTTSKFGAAVNTEIFTSNANNTNLAINVDYQGPVADLQITAFSEAADPVRTGQDVVYTVTADNAGPTDATSVTVTLTPALPNPANVGRFTFAENSIGNGTIPVVCVQPGGAGTVINCTIDNADMTAAATAVTFTVTGTLTLDATVPTSDQLMTAAIVTAGTTSDSNAGNSTANVTTTIRREAALSVSNFSAPTTRANGLTFTYTFDVANSGLDNATSSVVTLALPQNANAVTFSGNSFTNQACAGTTVVTCTIGTINAGASGVGITVTVTPSTLGAGVASSAFNGSITNIASPNVVSTGGTKTAANLLTTIQRQTTISVANLVDTVDPIASSANISYTVDVSNTGANIATNIKLDFTVPTGTTTATAGCALQSATLIRCTIASVPTGGGAQSFGLTVTPPASFVLSNQSSAAFNTSVVFNPVASTEVVDSGAGSLTDGSEATTVERRADVQLFNLTATPTVSSDGNITVQAQVQNLSGATATNVQVVFTFDNNYRFQSANVVNANGIPNTPAFSCATGTATTRTCTIPNLPISTLYTFNVIVKAESGIVATNNPTGNNTNVNVSATITASVIQSPNTGNDTSGPLVTEVQRQANLRASGASTAFTGPVSAINSSATATYNLTVRNDGPDTTDGAVVDFTFTNNVVASLDTSAGAQTAWGGLGTCVRMSASLVRCTMAAGYAVAARSGVITITPDTATLLASTNSATYDVTASIASPNAYDNGTSGAAGADNTTNIVTTTVQRQADLRLVSKTAPAAVADGGTITYTIVVQNFGPDAAGSVRLVDPLPVVTNGGFTLNAVGATFVSPTIPAGVCTPNSGSPTAPPVTVVCMLGPLNSVTLVPGEKATITITGVANIDPNVSSAAFNNVATVDAAQNAGDPVGGGTQTAFETNGGNNSNTVVSTTVSRSANLYMVDPVVSTPVLIGGALDPGGPGTPYVVGTHQAIQYDISVGNNAASSTDVTTGSVQVTLPSTLTFSASASPACSAVGQIVTCPVPGTLLRGGPTTTVSFVATPGGTLPVSGSNVALTITPSVTAAGNTDPDGSDNVVNNTTTVNRVSDLGIVQTQPPLPISVTNSPTTATYTYTWTVTNNGPSNATGVVVTNPLPADLQFISGSWPLVTGTPSGSCTGASTFGATITCNLSTVNNGASVPITVTVRPVLNTALANKSVINQPSISGLVQDNTSSNNSSSTALEIRGVTDLQTTITPVQDPAASAGEVLVGNNQTWAITVTNNGPYPAGSVITLTDTLAPGVALVGVQSTGFNCVGLTCTLSSLAVGANQTVNVTTTTPAAVVTGQTTAIPNSAVVTQYGNGTNIAGDVTDPTPGNNTGNSSVTGRAAANLSVSQVSPASVVVGQSGTKFTVTVSNGAARSDATNVVLTNTFVVDAPTSVSTTAFGTPSQGSCNAATGLGTANITITCNLGSIVSGGQATVDLALTPTLGGTLKNTPSVTGTEVDPVPANNTAAQATITVNTTPPGQQTFNPTDPANGQPVTSVVLSGFILIPGNTTIEVPIPTSTGLSLPANYRFGSSGAKFYNIANTATFNNNGITVCILTPETFFQPHRVRIFRLNPAADITTSTGFVQTGPAGTHKVCGTVSSLPSGGSTFVAMEPINTVPPLANATVTITGTGGKGAAGTSVTLDGGTVIDPDNYPCMDLQTLATTGVAAPTNCVDQNLLIFRWVGNFTDISRVDPVTGLKLIEKDCRQTTPFFDNQPCNKVETSLSLGASTVTLTVLDENFLLNPPAASKTFQVGVTGSSGAGQTQTVSVGQSGTFTFSYTYGANTTFAFVGSPALAANGITCSAQPLTYTGPVGGTQTANVTVLCSTSAPVFGFNSAPSTNNNGGAMVAGIVGLTGLPLVGMVLMPGRSRRHRMLRILAIFALITLMVVFQAACGGGTTGGGFGGAPKQLSAGTAKGDYVITVNPSPAPLIPVPTLTLKVQ